MEYPVGVEVLEAGEKLLKNGLDGIGSQGFATCKGKLGSGVILLIELSLG